MALISTNALQVCQRIVKRNVTVHSRERTVIQRHNVSCSAGQHHNGGSREGAYEQTLCATGAVCYLLLLLDGVRPTALYLVYIYYTLKAWGSQVWDFCLDVIGRCERTFSLDNFRQLRKRCCFSRILATKQTPPSTMDGPYSFIALGSQCFP